MNSPQKTAISALPWSNWILAAIVAALFCFVCTVDASAADWLKTGVGGGLDEKVNTAFDITLAVVRVVLVIIAIITFIKFIKDKEWINLLFVAIAVIGVAYAPKVVGALFDWGAK